jgi:hypothetical protein
MCLPGKTPSAPSVIVVVIIIVIAIVVVIGTGGGTLGARGDVLTQYIASTLLVLGR